MTSAGQLPYQLRPNKAVERLVFVELLRKLEPTLQLATQYRYVGFGGPQMEDFRILHASFPAMKMLSIERDAEVLKRQRFNCPHTNVRCKRQTSGDFVLSASGTHNLIVWLDYAEADERPTQIAEFQSLLQNLKSRSIVKLTLNAEPSTLGGSPGQPGLQAARLAAFRRDFDRCFPAGMEEEMVVSDNFPSALLTVVDYAAKEVLRADWRFQLLTSAAYADSRQQMMTVTGIVGSKVDLSSVLITSQLTEWEFARLSISDPPVRIRVPELTLKERIFIDQLLPRLEKQPAKVQQRLRFLLDKTRGESEEKLRSYLLFQRHYPFWGKVSV
jgi:hypothetical protein